MIINKVSHLHVTSRLCRNFALTRHESWNHFPTKLHRIKFISAKCFSPSRVDGERSNVPLVVSKPAQNFFIRDLDDWWRSICQAINSPYRGKRDKSFSEEVSSWSFSAGAGSGYYNFCIIREWWEMTIVGNIRVKFIIFHLSAKKKQSRQTHFARSNVCW